MHFTSFPTNQIQDVVASKPPVKAPIKLNNISRYKIICPGFFVDFRQIEGDLTHEIVKTEVFLTDSQKMAASPPFLLAPAPRLADV